MLATYDRSAEQTARACLRLAHGNTAMARAAIETSLRHARRATTTRTRTERVAAAEAALVALDDITTKES